MKLFQYLWEPDTDLMVQTELESDSERAWNEFQKITVHKSDSEQAWNGLQKITVDWTGWVELRRTSQLSYWTEFYWIAELTELD